LTEAYGLARARDNDFWFGGVAIAERHARRGDEHERLLQKAAAGCRFFVTQAVYDAGATKSLLSDYARALRQSGHRPVPIIFTFSPCGSLKTLELMKWLGIAFPRWLENELLDARDILETSARLCIDTWKEVLAFAREKALPVGLNVESISIRKEEVEASAALFSALRSQFATIP
jgi:5,10-methylenetetrahydrofolate reductase